MPSLTVFHVGAAVVSAFLAIADMAGEPGADYDKPLTLYGMIDIVSPCPGLHDHSLHQKACDGSMSPRLVLTFDRPVHLHSDAVNRLATPLDAIIKEVELDYADHNPTSALEKDYPGNFLHKPVTVSGAFKHVCRFWYCRDNQWINDYIFKAAAVEVDPHAQP